MKLADLESKLKLLSKIKKSCFHFKTTSTSSHGFIGPSRYTSLSGKYYVFVIVDDYSRCTWVLFLANKDGAKRFNIKKIYYFMYYK